MTDNINPQGDGFDCVEPKWGDQLWRYHEPDLDPKLRQGLADHLFICDACQLSRASEEALAAALSDGRVTAAPATSPQVISLPWLRWGSVAAVAASLVLMLVLPPTGRQAGGVRRGASPDPHFQRPVEGEVLRTSAPELKWSAIPGATSYQVQISEVGGPYQWSAATDEPSIRIPADQPLPDDGIFRGVVQPVPADLVGMADVSVAFSRSGWREFALYRAGASPLWLRLLTLVGASGLVLNLVFLVLNRGLQRRQKAIRG